MSLTVVAIIEAPAAHQQQFEQALRGMLAPTRAESGCLQYDLHQDLDQPERWVMLERWASAQALEAHLASPHFLALKDTLEGKVARLDVLRLNALA